MRIGSGIDLAQLRSLLEIFPGLASLLVNSIKAGTFLTRTETVPSRTVGVVENTTVQIPFLDAQSEAKLAEIRAKGAFGSLKKLVVASSWSWNQDDQKTWLCAVGQMAPNLEELELRSEPLQTHFLMGSFPKLEVLIMRYPCSQW